MRTIERRSDTMRGLLDSKYLEALGQSPRQRSRLSKLDLLLRQASG